MKKFTAWILFLAVYIGHIAPMAVIVNGQNVRKMMIERLEDADDGLTFRLSEGVEGAESRVKQPLASTEPIGPDNVQGLLKRIPAIKTDPSDEAEFAKRIGTLPAPKTGTKIPVKFPSDDMRAPPVNSNGGTLEVIRFSPEGEVNLAPDLSVTFSQPMVAVSSQEEAAKFAPVEFSPQVEGRWRWLGTKTLMFDTDKRFPMATQFTARVPAGTRSANGQVLAKDATWTFTTPPPKVTRMHPNGGTTRRDQLMYAAFDQAINPAAVLAKTIVTAAGKRIAVRLATAEEIAGDSTISNLSKDEQPGRWLAFRAVTSDGATENALPGASTIAVSFDKGTPSAEGPIVTKAAQGFSFQTFGPMAFRGAYCGWRNNKTCSPFENWQIEFSNTINPATLTKEMIKIEPAVEGVKISPSGNSIYISGYKKGNTTYKITISGEIADIYGQTLGKDVTATIKVGNAPQNLYSQGGTFSVLDPMAKPTFSVYSTNHNEVRVRLYKVEPTDFGKFGKYLRNRNYDTGTNPQPTVPGRLVSDSVVKIENKPDEMVETRINLAPALTNDLGNVIVDIEPTVKRDRYDRTRILTWLQATQIGLDAFVDNNELVGFATDLKTGRPLGGVTLSIHPNGNAVSSNETQEVVDDPGVLTRLWNWVTSFGSGGPSADETEAFEPDGARSMIETVEQTAGDRTAANGILRLELPANRSSTEPNMLIARLGKDVAFLPENADYYWNDHGSWYKKPDNDRLRWFVFDDRKLYKPKEEVSVKGYIRRVTGGKFGDVAGLGDAAAGITYTVKDSRDNEIAKGTAELNAFGAFDLKFKLPDNVNLGNARVTLSTSSGVPGSNFDHSFQIQEFRRPEFEVVTKIETEAPHFVGSSAMVGVEAKYYAGGGLPNAETNWTVTSRQTNYTPPNRDDFTFGTWVPWWRFSGNMDMSYGRGGHSGGRTETFKGVTDASGKHLLKIDFESVNPPRPYSIVASAAVQDVNRQTWSSSASMLVHPASLYVGIRTPRTFVQKGENIKVESIVTDIDGNLVPGRATEVRAQLKDWQFDNGSWSEKVIDEQTCTVTSSNAPDVCNFVAKQGGRYTITATVMDDRERFNESEFTVWVPGGKTPPNRNVEQEEAQIIPSKKDYAPGDVAELLVIAPFSPADGVLTLRREGIVKTERFTIKDSSITLKVPIDEKYLPNINAQVDLVGAADRQDDKGEIDPKAAKRPAFASGNINLNVRTKSRELTVSAEARAKTLAPGGETKVDVAVTDHRGEPVANSEVALVIVDESVLALSAYSIADPMSVFYTQRPTGVTDHRLRAKVLLSNPADVKPSAEVREAMALDGVETSVTARSMAGSPPPPPPSAKMVSRGVLGDAVSREEGSPEAAIDLRSNFDALVLFSPSVRTDSSGKAVVDVKLPDNLTRYRITAVSVDTAKRFGKTESNITAKQPLMIRPSAPRFLNFGDKASIPVVIQNQTDKDMAVDVAIRMSNAVVQGTATDGKTVSSVQSDGRRVVVKANDRAEVRFLVATQAAGTARFQFVATSGSFNDAAEISLPVWTPATAEAFATYGTTDQNQAIFQPVQAPGDVFPQFGGLEVTTSSTQLQELTDAFLYLTNYPYACSEQIASRMISIAAMRDVLSAFKAKDMPTKEELDGYFKRDIELLASRQRSDGSFGLWKRDEERYKYPFLTVHVAHALALAKSKGYKVPDGMLNRTKPYMKDVEKKFDQWHANSPKVRWTISAYALYIRDMMGDKDTAKAKKLLAEATIQEMPFEALGWILSVLANDASSQTEVQAIIRHLMNRTTETAAAANFVTNYGDGAWLIMYSNRRADGVLLEAMIKADVNNDLIPKLVRGLLANRTKGAWSNTQENVFILLALDKYFNAFEKVTPDFVTRVWLGNTYAGEQVFKGRSVDSKQLEIPMSYLVGQQSSGVNTQAGSLRSDLIIDRQGAGRLYYRIGMKYAPKNLKLEPADYGFTVLRKYEAIDDKDDVIQNADGSWTIKSGARVRVRLTMVAQARRYHVALVDNLPAGLEILNPSLATTEVIPGDTGGGNNGVLSVGSQSMGRNFYWWRQNWFEHQNFRDERSEAFASLLWEGVYNYSYVARATTPGQFVVPPAKAEEMYHPETFGRSGTDFVRVE